MHEHHNTKLGQPTTLSQSRQKQLREATEQASLRTQKCPAKHLKVPCQPITHKKVATDEKPMKRSQTTTTKTTTIPN